MDKITTFIERNQLILVLGLIFVLIFWFFILPRLDRSDSSEETELITPDKSSNNKTIKDEQKVDEESHNIVDIESFSNLDSLGSLRDLYSLGSTEGSLDTRKSFLIDGAVENFAGFGGNCASGCSTWKS